MYPCHLWVRWLFGVLTKFFLRMVVESFFLEIILVLETYPKRLAVAGGMDGAACCRTTAAQIPSKGI